MTPLPRFSIASSHNYIDRLIAINLVRPNSAFIPGVDTIFVAHEPDETPLAVLLARPLSWVHGFNLKPDLHLAHAVHVSRDLMAYAQGAMTNVPLLPRGCIFQTATDNEKMKEFARALGGVPEPDSIVFRIDYL